MLLLSFLVLSATSEPTSAPVSAPVEVALPPAPLQSFDTTRQAFIMFAAGAGAAVVSVPVMVVVGTWLGSLSSNLIGALLPSILLLAIVPPLAVTAAAFIVGDALKKDSVRFGPAYGVTVALQVAGIVVAALTGVSAANTGSMVAFTIAEAAVLPLGATLMMTLGRPAAPLSGLAPRDAFEQQAQARLSPIFAVGF